jgi:hypothetical protein
MPFCGVCDGNDFENTDGFYYCNICGTKYEVAMRSMLFFLFFLIKFNKNK